MEIEQGAKDTGPSKAKEDQEPAKEEEESQWKEFTKDPWGYSKKMLCTNIMANIPAYIILFLGIITIPLVLVSNSNH